jgi:hypothetical protein
MQLVKEIISGQEERLFTSTAALYELVANYEVGTDYYPENKQNAVGKINRIKSLLINIRTTMDHGKLDYKDFRKSLNNIFVLLNKSAHSIEESNKILKNKHRHEYLVSDEPKHFSKLAEKFLGHTIHEAQRVAN